ncbi:MAG: alpha/beta hydrolase [Deltaproteobacteria bacterium]|nr:alpha/beta hydrolase [Deltaproteobacteria bacterium]
MFKRFSLSLALMATLALLAACAPTGAQRWERETQRSWAKGFRPLSLYAPTFHLSALLKGEKNSDLVVYIEGDGRAIIHGQPASDPTPRDAQSLELALLDPAPVVMYLARIGQFQTADATKANEIYWSDKRLSEEAVTAANTAVNQVKELVGATRLHLVGYSGGGGLATLMAERRLDVASLVTVAGLLDTDFWVQNRGWRPLTGSLNPIKQARALIFVPQIHIYGTKDQIIDPQLSARFLQAARFENITRLAQDTDHYSGWTKRWPEILTNYAIPLRNSPTALPAAPATEAPQTPATPEAPGESLTPAPKPIFSPIKAK